MKLKKWPLIAALGFATFFIIGCGDNKDPGISDWGRRCLKIMEYGGTCNPNGGTGTGTATGTGTVTQTVTVTQTQTNH